MAVFDGSVRVALSDVAEESIVIAVNSPIFIFKRIAIVDSGLIAFKSQVATVFLFNEACVMASIEVTFFHSEEVIAGSGLLTY